MSTRCTVRIYETDENGKPYEGEFAKPIMLYHHSDGYPEFMVPLLEKFLKKTHEFMSKVGFPYWWDQERVAATMILLSAEDYEKPLLPFHSRKRSGSWATRDRNSEIPYDAYRPKGGIPEFAPCSSLHGDLEYLYDVYLLRPSGTFKIEYRERTGSWDKNNFTDAKVWDGKVEDESEEELVEA